MKKILNRRMITSCLYIFTITTLVLGGLPALEVKATGENLILNPSLEDQIGGLPEHWQQGGWGTSTVAFIYPVEGTAGAGSKAAKVEITDYTSGDAKWYFAEVPVTPGSYYEFSDKYISTVGTRVVVQYNLGGSYTYEQIGIATPVDSWQTFEASIIAPVGAVSATIFHLIDSVGSLTVDDYSLIESENPNAFDQGLVSLAFDDGWESVYNHLTILDNAGFKSTQYIITDTVLQEQGGYVTTEEVLAMYNNGHDIASHSKTHQPGNEAGLIGLLPADLQSEVFGSRYDLLATSTIGVKPADSLAYPYGQYDNAAKQAIINAGYLGARTVEPGLNTKSTDRYLLKSQIVQRDTTLAQVEDWIDTAAASKTWLILVFHQIDNSPENIYGTTPEMLQNIVNYLTSKSVSVKTITEALHLLPGVSAAGDSSAPVIAAHDPVVIETDSASGMIVNYDTPTVADNIDPNLVAACSPISGSMFSMGETPVTCQAADTSGNMAAPITFTVMVQDTTAPVITLNGEATINLHLGDSYAELGATATDNLDGDISANIIIGGDTVNTAVLGTYLITYDVSDAAGNNAATVIRTVNVLPIISQETTTVRTTNSITVIWTTDHPATSRVIYDTVSHATLGTAPNYGYANSTTEVSTLVTSHSVAVSGLDSGTTYYLRTVSHGSPETVSSELLAKTTLPAHGGGGGIPFIPSHLVALDGPLTINNGQSGTLTVTFGAADQLVVNIPQGAVSGNTTFKVTPGILTDDQKPLASSGAYLIGDRVYNITATATNGQPVRDFSQLLKIDITLADLPAEAAELAVYYFNEQTNEWLLVSEATFNFATKTASFSVNHLTKFAIFQTAELPTVMKVGPVSVGGPTAPQVLGVKKYSAGTLVRGQNKKIYLINGDETLTYIKNLIELRKYLGQKIYEVADEELTAYAAQVSNLVNYAPGNLIRGTDKKVYLIGEAKALTHIKSLSELRNYLGQKINNVSDETIAQYK